MKYFDKWVLTHREPPTSNVMWVRPTDKDVDKGAEIKAFIDNEWVTVSGEGYAPPPGGIPKSDLSESVQASLDKADRAALEDLIGQATTGAISIRIQDTGMYLTTSNQTLCPGETITATFNNSSVGGYIVDTTSGDVQTATILVTDTGEVTYTNNTNSIKTINIASSTASKAYNYEVDTIGLPKEALRADVQASLGNVHMPIVAVSESATTLNAACDTLYKIGQINTFTITLPAVEDYSHSRNIKFLVSFNSENSPSVTFIPARVGDEIIGIPDNFSAASTYLIDAIWAGGVWLLRCYLLSFSTKSVKSSN